MTQIRIDKIGLVANFSEIGNWAFDLAFHLSQSHSYQLNIFNFAESPFTMPLNNEPPKNGPQAPMNDKMEIESEKQMREYYDELLGDFTDVGFKVCWSHRHNYELRQCLKKKDYQVLVIPYLKRGVPFGNMPLEEFAYRFISPVILVGPDEPQTYTLNTPAEMILDSLDVPAKSFNIISQPEKLQHLKVI